MHGFSNHRRLRGERATLLAVFCIMDFLTYNLKDSCCSFFLSLAFFFKRKNNTIMRDTMLFLLIILAILSLIAAISSAYSKKIQKKLKNKMLTSISISFIASWIIIAVVSIKFYNTISLPIILLLYVVNKIDVAQWYIAKEKYLRNFTIAKTRAKITFAFEMIVCLSTVVLSLIGAKILDLVNIKYAILVISLGALAIMIVALDYMKKRFGLKPKQYAKEDIRFN